MTGGETSPKLSQEMRTSTRKSICTECGASWLGASYLLGELSLGRVVLGRVVFWASCPVSAMGPFWSGPIDPVC